jgi:hypothetical protein
MALACQSIASGNRWREETVAVHSRGCPRLHLVDPLSMCLAQRLLMYSSIDGAHYKEYAELQKKCASAPPPPVTSAPLS